MNKVILSIFFSVSLFSANAQDLFGVTFNGGNNNNGTVNKLGLRTNTLTAMKSFDVFPSGSAGTHFTQATDGKLYAATSGSSFGNSLIFSFDPATGTQQGLKVFADGQTQIPTGALLCANNGKLYGLTLQGTHNYGALYSYDPVSNDLIILKNFEGIDGANPLGSLIQVGDGKLYGMTNRGGTNDAGVIFSFDLSSSSLTVLWQFDGEHGSNPAGSLVEASDGKLYGMTPTGGVNGIGVIFSYDVTDSTFTKLVDFDNNGNRPKGSLVEATDGRLYGMTLMGGDYDKGVIFSFERGSLQYAKLKDFTDDDGSYPDGTLMQATDGKLYGLTSFGGSDGISTRGVIFSFDPSLNSYSVLRRFGITEGNQPTGDLIQAANGKLYGMTYAGAFYYEPGSIFSYDPSLSEYAEIKKVNSNETGSNISGSLVKGKDGKFYGMTTYGGRKGNGVIFSLDSSGTYEKLSDLDYVDGSYPYGSLLQARNGKFYGLTSHGGFDEINYYDLSYDKDLGTIFSFDPVSSVYTRLLDCNNYTVHTGCFPYGSLIQATDGKLYGMTSGGGGGYRGQGAGVIFSFDLTLATYARLKDFANFDGDLLMADVLNGSSPYGSLLQAGDGRLYGMTSLGGNYNLGVLFSFDPSSSIYIKVRDFDSTNGSNPYGSLIQARDGKLYGMTWGGGSHDAGVIFSYDPFSSIYARLHDFDYANGSHPYGNLMQSSDGKLYGMTSAGGNYDYGVIFSFDPGTKVYAKLIDYDGTNGAVPYFGSGFIELGDPIPTPVPEINGREELKVLPNPNNGLFSVRMNLNSVKEVAFNLYNVTGQIIYQSPKYLLSGTETKLIDGTKLASGVYVLQTKIGDKSLIQKIIINR